MKHASIRSIDIVMPTRLGFHLRAVAGFVKCMLAFHSVIRVHKGRSDADGKSVLELLTLGAPWKSKLNIEAEGDDAKQAIKGVEDYFDNETRLGLLSQPV